MHRVRTSLPYFKQLGWDAEVVVVNEKHADVVKDNFLLQSIPKNIKIHTVSAFNRQWTSKIGLGSLALRSLWYYYTAVNKILKSQKFDLIYFSTTQFPVCTLGAFWKKKFKLPYVIDMQDPWHSEYYKNKPKHLQPKKYWFSYRLHKNLEPIAMKHVNGLISVSDGYIRNLEDKYPALKNIPTATIPFSAHADDLDIAHINKENFSNFFDEEFINIAYVGRGGNDMEAALSMLFKVLKTGIEREPGVFGKLRFYFIGTSYAPEGQGKPTILPVAEKYGVQDQVTEITGRVSYYHAIYMLQQADALFIPGSDDPKYTASKIYPSLLMKKPLMAIFRQESSVADILTNDVSGAVLITLPPDNESLNNIYKVLNSWSKREFNRVILKESFNKFSSLAATAAQVELFNRAIDIERQD
ncbi:MAG: hypothetical protein EOP47_12905 [Sphingobacteriaceae bacterium]|nr:MAG: hypothetical protein EOP47_12905 [Sphingobacteriaceae bacterium]